MKLLTSGDIELNPGPEQNLNSQTILSAGSTMLLNLRLLQPGLRTVNVGGEGTRFFQAFSLQLYGDPNHHLLIRQVGVQNLSNNPEHFIESNTENARYMVRCTASKSSCRLSKCKVDTRCDALFVHCI